jgi:hypothetical protein
MTVADLGAMDVREYIGWSVYFQMRQEANGSRR